jgi:hypothetical protein
LVDVLAASHQPKELVDVTLLGADRTQEHDFGLPLRGARRDGDRLLVDIQPDEQCASVCPG